MMSEKHTSSSIAERRPREAAATGWRNTTQWRSGTSITVGRGSLEADIAFLDYQVPLKAKQADYGIGKIDLLGVTDRGRLIVVELKYPRNGRGDSPQHAFMEGLRYAAIVEANLEPLAREAGKRFGIKVDDKIPPVVQVLGPCSWWRDWLNPGLKSRAAGDWNRAFARLASAVEARIGAAVECMAMDGNTKFTPGLYGREPSIDCPPTLYLVRLDRNPPAPAFEALP